MPPTEVPRLNIQTGQVETGEIDINPETETQGKARDQAERVKARDRADRARRLRQAKRRMLKTLPHVIDHHSDPVVVGMAELLLAMLEDDPPPESDIEPGE